MNKRAEKLAALKGFVGASPEPVIRLIFKLWVRFHSHDDGTGRITVSDVVKLGKAEGVSKVLSGYMKLGEGRFWLIDQKLKEKARAGKISASDVTYYLFSPQRILGALPPDMPVDGLRITSWAKNDSMV